MGMIVGFFYLVYIIFCKLIYAAVKKSTNKKWIKNLTICIFILIPTYDIIITNILGFYYCNTMPKPYIKETVEYPESIYFENNVIGGYDEKAQKYMIEKYLDGIHLKSIALNLSSGEVVLYSIDDKSEKYQEFLKLDKEHKLAEQDEENIRKSMHEKLDGGIIKRQSEEHNRYVNDIILKEKRAKELNKQRDEIWQNLIARNITTKENMPKMNYVSEFNEMDLNRFVLNFFHGQEDKIFDNIKKKAIAYNRKYFSIFYNIAPDFGGNRKYSNMCLCGFKYDFNDKVFVKK